MPDFFRDNPWIDILSRRGLEKHGHSGIICNRPVVLHRALESQRRPQSSRTMDGPSGIETVLYEIRDAVKTMVDLLNRHHIVIQPILIPVESSRMAILHPLICSLRYIDIQSSVEEYAKICEKILMEHPGALVVPGSNPGGPTNKAPLEAQNGGSQSSWWSQEAGRETEAQDAGGGEKAVASRLKVSVSSPSGNQPSF